MIIPMYLFWSKLGDIHVTRKRLLSPTDKYRNFGPRGVAE